MEEQVVNADVVATEQQQQTERVLFDAGFFFTLFFN